MDTRYTLRHEQCCIGRICSLFILHFESLGAVPFRNTFASTCIYRCVVFFSFFQFFLIFNFYFYLFSSCFIIIFLHLPGGFFLRIHGVLSTDKSTKPSRALYPMALGGMHDRVC